MTQQIQENQSFELERPPLFTPDTQGLLSPREEVMATYVARLGSLRLSDCAKAAGLSYKEARLAYGRPSFQMAVAALLEQAKGFASAGAVTTVAGRIVEKASRHQELSRIVQERAMAADPRYLNPDRVFLSSLRRDDGSGYDVDELLRLFPSIGEMYDETNPVCAMVDPDSFMVPGASSGLLAQSVKTVGKGDASRTVVEWRVDEALVRQISSHEESVAKATGQDKKGAGGRQKAYININMGRLMGGPADATDAQIIEEAK